MIRRLAFSVVALAAALVPLAANAAITPDNSYGTGGTATVPLQCATGSYAMEDVGYGGRVYVLQRCAGGYFSVVAVGDDGQLLDSWGTHGHVTIKAPAGCNGASWLKAAKDGSVHVAFETIGHHGTDPTPRDMHLCLAKVTSNGTLLSTYGGSGPFRHLDLLSATGTSTQFARWTTDAHGRLLVFSERWSRGGQHDALFVNRFATNGRPDVTFQGHGQHVYSFPNQGDVIWAGAIRDDPVFAIQVVDLKRDGVVTGTLFVRLTTVGSLNGLFAGDGKLLVRNSDLGGAYILAGSVVLDSHNRIVYAAQNGGHWIDLRRLSGAGSNDSAFNAATARIQAAPGGQIIPGASLNVTTSRYLVGWSNSESGPNADRLTGFNANGTRWAAVGPNGTAKVWAYLVEPDRAGFYAVKITGDPETMTLHRSLIQ